MDNNSQSGAPYSLSGGLPDDTESLSDVDKTRASNPKTSTESSTILTPATSASDPMIGAQIEEYLVLSELGKGGFARVYLVRDIGLNRQAALKMLKDPLDPMHADFFAREAKAIANTKHPGIVTLYKSGMYQGKSYFVLELLEASAEHLLKDSPGGLPLKQALSIVADVADGLAFAHKRKILHRDIKPGNILLDEEGRGKLTDFGLARVLESSQVSISGGTPLYMSPEQALGKSATPLMDVYSLGVTLYELLSGQRPVDGTSQGEVIRKIVQNERIPLKDRKPELPPVVVDIVEKAIAPNPDDRFQSASELARQLRAVLRAMEQETDLATITMTKPPSVVESIVRQPSRVAAIAAVLFAVVFLGVWAARSVTRPLPPALAGANDKLDQGDSAALQEAERLYREYLAAEADNQDALYGLAYALLLQGKLDEAKTQFAALQDAKRKTEGTAATAFEEKGEAAREDIEKARAAAGSAYPDTLLGKLDLLAEKYDEVTKRLESARSRDKYNFDWQHNECLQALAQAYYRLKDFERASAIFDELKKSESRSSAGIAAEFVQLVKDQADAQRQDKIIKRGQELRAQLDQLDLRELTPEEKWRSRPLPFAILPVEVLAGHVAIESGLDAVLPVFLRNALEEESSMPAVNREDIEAILSEQTLASLVGNKDGQRYLGRLVSARVMIRCKFNRFQRNELLTTEVVDTETTDIVATVNETVPRTIELDSLVSGIASKISEAIQDAYPVRGKLAKEESQLKIDVGSPIGVEEGMRFKVCTLPDLLYLVPDYTVEVKGPVGSEAAIVEPQGFSLDEVPDEGWYVTELTESAEAATKSSGG
ncbi:MAG: serine/threonine protein kinase [Candidatus Hydrogenedentes bacterium]|nr:serine/threonine protein kinase [Candidatus Hydrogenedentota bacterium]